MPSIPDDELGWVLNRVTRALDRWPSLPYEALAYRLGEVGSERIESRLLSQVLSIVANEQNPGGGFDAGPWQPHAGILVSSRNSSRDAKAIALTTEQELLGFKNANHKATQRQLVSILLQHITTKPPQSIEGSTQYSLNGIPSTTSVFPGVPLASGISATLLISHDTEPLYPDSSQLWTAIREARNANERLVVVARAITPAAFPLFKALAIQALQYYSMLVQDNEYEHLQRLREKLGWIHIRPISELREHRLLGHLDAVAARLTAQPSIPESAVRGIDEALTLRIDKASAGNAWGSWMAEHGEELGLSSAWLSTTTRWNTWLKESRATKPFPRGSRAAMLMPLEERELRRVQRPRASRVGVEDTSKERQDRRTQEGTTRVFRIGVRV